MEAEGKFYLGRLFDQKAQKTSADPLLYSLEDLTTHAVILGMTGSGKTGLCIDLLEEAALNQVPAMMIDPKGDITNLLLQFPELLPQDFQPWINPDEARREGKTLEQAASEMAERWRTGLGQWGIEPDRIQALKNAAGFAVYTPGSEAGIPVSILASLKAPTVSWETNRDLLREKISGTVTALLGLVGLPDIDPVRSREHILMSNIFENHWRQGSDLDLGELILQIQNPPFEKLGVFDVDKFFPEKDRFELAMLLNNILASPSFQGWIVGEPLDVGAMMYTAAGKPRHSIFYIAHLNDQERMFFVTLLYSAVEAWMRGQSGTTTLRAIVYFDEIYGYMPPIGNPPPKMIMLRMLKQARAFGVGQVLVTQNPVDLDYKGLSNTGTWFIGKLQTEKDKQRLLDGLEGALGGLDRDYFDKTLSGLGKRVFLMHNVHENSPALFQTRWAMSYLAGPLTRTQIPMLNQLAGAAPHPPAAGTAAAPTAAQPADQALTQPTTAAPTPRAAGAAASVSATRPLVPAGVIEYILPLNLTLQQAFEASGQGALAGPLNPQVIYRPALLAQASVNFLNRKYNLDYELARTVLAGEVERRGAVRWDEFPAMRLDPRKLDDAPANGAKFAALEAPFTEARLMKALDRDFQDWAYRDSAVIVRANEALQVYAGQQVSPADFRKMCSEAARKQRDAEVKKIEGGFDTKINAIHTRLAKAERALETSESELNQRQMDEWGTHADNLLRMVLPGKRTKISTSMSKRRMTQQAKADVQDDKAAITDMQKQIADLEEEKAAALEEVNARWGETANQITEIKITPLKKDIFLELFGVAWVPYYVVTTGTEIIELPGFGPV